MDRTIERIKVAEIYSPERVNKVAEEIGLGKGWSVDLTNGWDLTKVAHKNEVVRRVLEDKPMLVIGSMVSAPLVIQQLILVDGWETTFTPASVSSVAKLNIQLAFEWSPTKCMEVSSACFPQRISAAMLREEMS